MHCNGCIAGFIWMQNKLIGAVEENRLLLVEMVSVGYYSSVVFYLLMCTLPIFADYGVCENNILFVFLSKDVFITSKTSDNWTNFGSNWRKCNITM